MTPEIKEKFLKENGIAIEDAIAHIKKWTSEKNFQSAENGISELKKFLGNSEEIENLEKEIFEIKNSQKPEAKKEEKTTSEELPEGTFDKEKDERILASISYFWFLAILPLVLKRDSKLCQHHGKQGVIFSVIFFLLTTIAGFLPFIGGAMLTIISLFQFGIAIYGGIQAFKGKMWNAPMVGDIAKKINF